MEEIMMREQSTSYNLIIPKEVEAKIRFICNNVWNVEWSGTLFYTYTGSFENNDVEFTVKDICVHDIGNATYTEFDMSPEVISYMTDNDLLDCQLGLIHSHNNMNTFFSGTDMSTLKEEGSERNHFLSLIVNNEGTYTAKVTRKIKSIQDIRESYSYNTFDDIPVENNIQYYKKINRIDHYTLKIVKEDDGFKQLGDKLANLKKAKTAPQTTIYNPNARFDTFVKEPTLFDDLNETKQEEPTYFDKNLIKEYALQIITGSIVIPYSSSIDIKKWVTNMPATYSKRFGEGDEGMVVFKVWISGLIEFILTYSDGETPVVEDYSISILAQELIDYLNTLPTNNYMKEIINELNSYIA